MISGNDNTAAVAGEFIDMAGERCYAIHNVDSMPPFFISIVSNSDHWLFISSNGGLTAGRVSPEHAMFPYSSVDKILESGAHTGSKTLLRVAADGAARVWEPFNYEHYDRFRITRNLYKNTLGNKIRFEEINHDLQLGFSYGWATSERYGFVRSCELQNLATRGVEVELLDGLQNLLPAGTPLPLQTDRSNLVDAYKWNELDPATGLALFTLYSGLSDRAEPCESLKATTVFCLGLDNPGVLLGTGQLEQFRRGLPLTPETRKRGIRGAYLVNVAVALEPGASRGWQIIADVGRSQSQAVELRRELRAREFVAEPARLRYLDLDDRWQELTGPAAGLAFTWCQLPLVYRLDDTAEPSITLTFDDASVRTLPGLELAAAESAEIFRRSRRIRRLDLVFARARLFGD